MLESVSISYQPRTLTHTVVKVILLLMCSATYCNYILVKFILSVSLGFYCSSYGKNAMNQVSTILYFISFQMKSVFRSWVLSCSITFLSPFSLPTDRNCPLKCVLAIPLQIMYIILEREVPFLIAEIIFSQFRNAFVGINFPKLGNLFLVFQKKNTMQEICFPDVFFFSEDCNPSLLISFWETCIHGNYEV